MVAAGEWWWVPDEEQCFVPVSSRRLSACGPPLSQNLCVVASVGQGDGRVRVGGVARGRRWVDLRLRGGEADDADRLAGAHRLADGRPRADGPGQPPGDHRHAAAALPERQDLHGHRGHPGGDEPLQVAPRLHGPARRRVRQGRPGERAAPVQDDDGRVQRAAGVSLRAGDPHQRRVRRGEDRDDEAVPEDAERLRGGRHQGRGRRRGAPPVHEPGPRDAGERQDGAQRQLEPLRQVHADPLRRRLPHQGLRRRRLPPGEVARDEPGPQRAVVPRAAPASRRRFFSSQSGAGPFFVCDESPLLKHRRSSTSSARWPGAARASSRPPSTPT